MYFFPNREKGLLFKNREKGKIRVSNNSNKSKNSNFSKNQVAPNEINSNGGLNLIRNLYEVSEQKKNARKLKKCTCIL